MDLYFQAAGVSLAGAALAYLIYVMMTPAQMFAPMIESTNAKIEARIDNAVNLDISTFNNNSESSGAAVYSLIQDASTNNLAIFVQTRAQKGLIVNYGPQLRSSQANVTSLSVHGRTGISSSTDFEKHYVTTVSGLFMANGYDGTGAAPGEPNGLIMGKEAYHNGGTEQNAASKYIELTYGTSGGSGDATAPVGMDLDRGLPGVFDPLIHFWDPFMETYAIASDKGRTFSATGYLWSANILRSNMPNNDNLSLAKTPSSVYYVNPLSRFYTTYIIDASTRVVGVYVEEHGCDTNGALLAEAMKAEGYIMETMNE